MEKKRYKHIKTGWEAEWMGGYNYIMTTSTGNEHKVPYQLVENSEDWELIPEPKEYTVLAYRDSVGNIYSWYSDGYKLYPEASSHTKEYCDSQYEIYSIRRDSDQSVFTIGDKVLWNWLSSPHQYETISKFEIDKDGEVGIYTEEVSKTKALYQGVFNELRHYQEPQDDESVHAVEWTGLAEMVIGVLEAANHRKMTHSDTAEAIITLISKELGQGVEQEQKRDVFTPEEREEMEHKNVYWAAERELGISWKEIKKIILSQRTQPVEQKKDAEPILVRTQDNVTITDPEQWVYWIQKWKVMNKKAKNARDWKMTKYWSTEDAVLNHIYHNKPILSLGDIIQDEGVTGDLSNIAKLVKERIKTSK